MASLDRPDNSLRDDESGVDLGDIRLTDTLWRRPSDGAAMLRCDAQKNTVVLCGVCRHPIDFDALLDYEHRKFAYVESLALPLKPWLVHRMQAFVVKALHPLRVARVVSDPDMRSTGRLSFRGAKPRPVGRWDWEIGKVTAEHDGLNDPAPKGYLIPAGQEHRRRICRFAPNHRLQ